MMIGRVLRPRRLHQAWVMIGLCFFGLLAAQGARLSFGAFVTPWQSTFGASSGTITFVSFVSFAVYGLTQPLVGRLVGLHGVRKVFSGSVLLAGVGLVATASARSTAHLLIAYGIVASLGFGGASGVAASVAVTEWFQTRRGLAFGVIEAGFGAGQLALAPAALLAIGAFGWRVPKVAMGIVLIVVVFPILVVFLRSSPTEVGLRPFGANEPTDEEERHHPAEAPVRDRLITSRAFWGLTATFFVCGFTTTGMIDTHLIPFAHDHGFSMAATGTAVGVLAAFNIAGTLASGPLADRWDNRRFLAALYGVRALTLLVLLAAHRPTELLAFAMIFGIADFAVLAPTQLLAARYFDGQSVGVVFGLLSLAHQLGSALGALVPGMLYDRTGGYEGVLAGAAVALTLGSVLSFALPDFSTPRRQLVPLVSA
jgi:MFS family permease